jgi:hypothetical protein
MGICPPCQVRQNEQHAAAAARLPEEKVTADERATGLERQVEGYERDSISTIEERDDLLQRLKNDGILEVNDLRAIIETIDRNNQEYEARVSALGAQQRKRLAWMEAQNAQIDTAILDLEEKLQIAVLEFGGSSADFKENKEKDTAIAATLAFAMVRSEGTAATQDQDLDAASADSDLEWTPRADNDNVALSSSSSNYLLAMPGAWAYGEEETRDREQSPTTETEDTHPCSTAVMGQDSTRKPSKPSRPPKLSNACSMSDDVPVRPAALGAVLQKLKGRLA